VLLGAVQYGTHHSLVLVLGGEEGERLGHVVGVIGGREAASESTSVSRTADLEEMTHDG
jgi:hypothetical protein